MDNKSTKSLDHRVNLIWAVSLPICWLIGYSFGTTSIIGSEIGAAMGLPLGGAIGSRQMVSALNQNQKE